MSMSQRVRSSSASKDGNRKSEGDVVENSENESGLSLYVELTSVVHVTIPGARSAWPTLKIAGKRDGTEEDERWVGGDAVPDVEVSGPFAFDDLTAGTLMRGGRGLRGALEVEGLPPDLWSTGVTPFVERGLRGLNGKLGFGATELCPKSTSLLAQLLAATNG